MNHSDFVRAYAGGDIRVDIDRRAAARFVSARLLLPFFMLPVLGIGTALALIGWLWTGLAMIAIGTLAPLALKLSAPHFVMTQALQDPNFYRDVYSAGIMHIVALDDDREALDAD